MDDTINNATNSYDECNCKTNYTIEEYNDYTELFYDRCIHKHGLKIAILKEVDFELLSHLIKKANEN